MLSLKVTSEDECLRKRNIKKTTPKYTVVNNTIHLCLLNLKVEGNIYAIFLHHNICNCNIQIEINWWNKYLPTFTANGKTNSNQYQINLVLTFDSNLKTALKSGSNSVKTCTTGFSAHLMITPVQLCHILTFCTLRCRQRSLSACISVEHAPDRNQVNVENMA